MFFFLIISASTFLIGIRIGSYKYKQPIQTLDFIGIRIFIQNINLLLVDSSILFPARGLEQTQTKGTVIIFINRFPLRQFWSQSSIYLCS